MHCCCHNLQHASADQLVFIILSQPDVWILQVFKMLRQDGERKAQSLKQADRDKRTLTKHLQEMQAKYDESCSKLYQLGQEMNAFKARDDPEKVRLKAQNEKLQGLCRLLRSEKKDCASTTASEAVCGPPSPTADVDTPLAMKSPSKADSQNGTGKSEGLQQESASGESSTNSLEDASHLTQ